MYAIRNFLRGLFTFGARSGEAFSLLNQSYKLARWTESEAEASACAGLGADGRTDGRSDLAASAQGF
jgi:hypothetical protein